MGIHRTQAPRLHVALGVWLAAFCLILPTAQAKPKISAALIHAAAWDSALVWTERLPSMRYAFYAYRSMTVPHPEVYLRADRLFSDVIENLPGSRAAYRTPDLRDLELFRRIARRELKGGAFGWSQWTIIPDSIFDAPTTLSWLDRRIPSAAILLKAASPRLSTMEAAMLRYTHLRRTGRADTRLFVVVDAAGRGFLWNDSLLIRGGIGATVSDPATAVQPALVFNERVVWYPLMGRDDRANDSVLNRVVAALGPAAAIPLDAADSSRVVRLREAAALRNPQEMQFAIVTASGLRDLNQPEVAQAWSASIGNTDTLPLECAAPMLDEVYYWADRLSPRTAELAAKVTPDKLDRSLTQLQERYLDWCGRHVNRADPSDSTVEAWGILWSSGLLTTGFDDIIRTRAGSGASQTLAMAAILDLAGVPHFVIPILTGKWQIPDQQWLITEDAPLQFNCGVWKKVGAPRSGWEKSGIVLTGYGRRGRWARYVRGTFYTDRDFLTVAEDLRRITDRLPPTTVAFSGESEKTVHAAQVMLDLAADKVPCRPLPWPSAWSTGAGTHSSQ